MARRAGSVRVLAVVLAIQVVLGAALILVVVNGGIPHFGGTGTTGAGGAPRVDRFDADRALDDVRAIVAFGPRPAGSPAARRLAAWLRVRLPDGRFEAIGGGLRNVVGKLPGHGPAVVVGAHYDTKDLPGFVGANDGAAGTAVVLELARALAAGRPAGGPELRFVLFDGEESPRGTPDALFARRGLRGSRAYARRHRSALAAVVVVDFVGQRELRLAREASSNAALWARMRAAAQRVGAGGTFPARTGEAILDDHTPFLAAGVPAIDLIDFDYPCFHRRCDTPARISRASLDRVGEALVELLRGLR